MKRGIFLGRFNPFHLGHLNAVKTILKEVDELIIAVGSSQQSHTDSNPFTAGERLLMIHETLKIERLQLEKVFCIPIYDIFRNPVWVSHVISLCPPFSIVYTNNSLTRRLFMEAGFEVRSPKLIKRTVFKGSHIRQLMTKNSRWEHLVPPTVHELIINVDGVKRVQEINQMTD